MGSVGISFTYKDPSVSLVEPLNDFLWRQPLYALKYIIIIGARTCLTQKNMLSHFHSTILQWYMISYIYMISYVCPSIFHICPYVSIYYFTCIFTDFHMIQDISGLFSHHFSRMTGLHLPHRGLQVVEQVQRHRPGRGLLTGADGGVVGGDGRLQPGWWNLWSGESWTNHPKMQDLFGISMMFLWSVHAKN